MDFLSVLAGLWFSITNFFGGGTEQLPPPPPLQQHDESGMHTHHEPETGIETEGDKGETAVTVTTDSSGWYTGSYGSASITTDGTYRYITSDGLPNHETGNFPNPGNPHTISEQDHSYRVLMNPVYTGTVTNAPIPGVALNGIPLEPGTAERYQDTEWAIEAFDVDGTPGLGIDWSNAHVQPDGTYHYHGSPEGLLESALLDQSGDLIQLAWASDGFPIYYSQSNAYDASWQLKSGARPSGPGGTYDGTYTQDFEYVAGSGDLDECNGIFIDGSYAYILTDHFPYIQRCVKGTPDSSFERFGGGQGPQGNTGTGAQGSGQGGPGGTPPEAAITACSGSQAGSSCSFSTPQGTISGTCQTPPNSSSLACVPAR